jgi:hypothetical protein
MDCALCNYEFCFMCLRPWDGPHGNDDDEDDLECPIYGDPLCGYDDKGFEKSPRGLHIYTGRDRDGYDRYGLGALGQPREHAVPSAEDIELFVAGLMAPAQAMAVDLAAAELAITRARSEKPPRNNVQMHALQEILVVRERETERELDEEPDDVNDRAVPSPAENNLAPIDAFDHWITAGDNAFATMSTYLNTEFLPDGQNARWPVVDSSSEESG